MIVSLSFRQALALYRVMQAMNLVNAQISTASDDLLTPEEMHELQRRLGEAVDRYPDFSWEDNEDGQSRSHLPQLRRRLRTN